MKRYLLSLLFPTDTRCNVTGVDTGGEGDRDAEGDGEADEDAGTNDDIVNEDAGTDDDIKFELVCTTNFDTITRIKKRCDTIAMLN